MTRFLTFILAAVATLFFLVESSQANFGERQDALAATADQHFNRASDYLDDVNSAYLAGAILWNNEGIRVAFDSYLSALREHKKTTAKYFAAARSYHNRRQRAFQKEIGSRKAPKCKARAQQTRRQGAKSWQRLRIKYGGTLRYYSLLDEFNKQRLEWINMPGTVTDGYIDGAIYDMFTGQLILLPDGISPIFDPDDLGPVLDLLYPYVLSADELYLSSFHVQDDRALRQLGKCRRR